MPFDSYAWPMGLVGAGIGGLFGSSVGSYLKAYWTRRGEQLATLEDIKTLLAQERAKSYEQEMGKRLATHEDIENVLREVNAVTKETETIKAQISSGLWLRQTVWAEKRTAYADLLKRGHELNRLYLELRIRQIDLAEVESNGGAGPEREAYLAKLRSDINDYLSRITDGREQLRDALIQAEIFIDGIQKFGSQLLIDKTLSLEGEPGEDLDNRMRRGLIAIDEWIGKLIDQARKDLGVEGPPSQ